MKKLHTLFLLIYTLIIPTHILCMLGRTLRMGTIQQRALALKIRPLQTNPHNGDVREPSNTEMMAAIKENTDLLHTLREEIKALRQDPRHRLAYISEDDDTNLPPSYIANHNMHYENPTRK
jgi:hypothetical protein